MVTLSQWMIDSFQLDWLWCLTDRLWSTVRIWSMILSGWSRVCQSNCLHLSTVTNAFWCLLPYIASHHWVRAVLTHSTNGSNRDHCSIWVTCWHKRVAMWTFFWCKIRWNWNRNPKMKWGFKFSMLPMNWTIIHTRKIGIESPNYGVSCLHVLTHTHIDTHRFLGPP